MIRRPFLALALLAPLAGSALMLAPALARTTEVTAKADGAYAIDAVHSSVVFKIKHNKVSDFYGRFNKIDGSFNVDPSKPEAASVNVTIDIESVDSNNKDRDKHLRNPDFFSAKEFPTATFKSTGLKKVGDTWELAGELNFHGVTKPITAKLEYGGAGKGFKGEDVAGITATFTIERSEFGVTKYPEVLGEDVTIIVALEGAK